jgi:methyl-accepting chemotaxis protein
MNNTESPVESNENNMSHLLEALSRVQAIIEFNLDGSIITANENFLSTMGYSLEEIEGKHHRIFCDPQYTKSSEYKVFWERVGRGEFNSGEYKRLNKSGDEVWINASYNPVLDSEGKPYKVIKFATDITAQKLQSADHNGKINAINRVQAVIEFNLDGTVISANDNFLSIFGYSNDEIAGKHHRIFCDEQYIKTDEYKTFWIQLGRGEYESGEYQRLTKSGEQVWINASYNPVLDAEGKPYKVVKFATDITAIKLQSADFRGKIKAISRAQAVIEFNSDGTIITANENFLNTLGYTLEEIVGKHHRIFCDPDYTKTGDYRAFWEKLGRGEFESARYRRFDKSGNEVWIQANYNPVFGLNGEVYKIVKFSSDISAQVALEERVTQIASNFNTQSKEISDQSSTVAEGAQVLGATTEEMNASVEELSASIDSIAQNTRETDKIAQKTQLEADHGSKAIARSIESMELINRSSEEISEIVKVISEIAGQTNLLAFNAAIEAARAGEHGLGFSVVADEVRKLAERSSQATKEISSLINQSVKRVVQGSEVSKEASEAFKKIVSRVEQTTQSIAEITVAAQEQQSVAGDVSDAIQQIVDSTERSAIASETIAKSTAVLSEEAANLELEMKKFAS